MKRNHTLTIVPSGQRIEVNPGSTLLCAIQAAGLEVTALCGGEGHCGKCRVQVTQGLISPPVGYENECLDRESLKSGYRLACQTRALGSLTLFIPPETHTTSQRLQLEADLQSQSMDPVVQWVEVDLTPANGDDQRPDARRLLDALSIQGISRGEIALPVLQSLSETLRLMQWQVRAVVDDHQVIGLLAPGTTPAGLAIDVGTTRVALYLVDLEHGAIRAKVAAVNPQVSYGDDVINRIAYANRESQGRKRLQDILLNTLNHLIEKACHQADCDPKGINDAVIVGNSAMHHLLTGLPVRQLGEAPFLPATCDAMHLISGDLDLHVAPAANIYLAPLIAGYLGADHVALLQALNLLSQPQPVLAIDIGTNTEVSVAADGRIFSCSCASGPAFEGAHISQGMRAIAGAIERVRLLNGKAVYQTIDHQKPIGICGSGILDAVAEMHHAGILDRTGRLFAEATGVSLDKNGSGFFQLADAKVSGNDHAIAVNQSDIIEIQLAKAAIRTGIEILLLEAGIGAADLKCFILAGAFGNYIDPTNAMRIGMFPNLPLSRFRQVGNAAGSGAINMLCDRGARNAAESLVKNVNYVELTTHPHFFDLYAGHLMFER